VTSNFCALFPIRRGAHACDVPLQTVHLVSESRSICSHLAKSASKAFNSGDTLSKYAEPVGAGAVRSAAGAGSRGAPMGKLCAQPANSSDSSSAVALRRGQSSFGLLARHDGAAVVGISTVSFLLHGALEPRLSFKGGGSLSEHACVIACGAIPTRSE